MDPTKDQRSKAYYNLLLPQGVGKFNEIALNIYIYIYILSISLVTSFGFKKKQKLVLEIFLWKKIK